MAKNLSTEIIDSVGIEVEFSNFDRNDKKIQKLISSNLPGYKQVHDASCETPVATFANTGLQIEFEDDNDFSKLEQVCAPATIGGEIVSPIRNSCGPKWLEEIHKLCELLWDLGEDEDSQRDSLHIHVNVSQDAPYFVVHNLLKLTATFEAILYRLGGMGRMNRGIENNYCYMRPFLGNGPPIISQARGTRRVAVPIMIYNDLLNAEGKDEFFHRYGDSVVQAGRRARYVVQRYMGVNFYPILLQGSFEFRTANKTLKPEYIIAWTNFCKALVEKAYSTRDKKSFEDKIRPLHENVEISEEDFLTALSYLSALDQDSIEVLTNIWNISPTPKFDNIKRWTHLREYPVYSTDMTKYLPEEIENLNEIADAEFMDVHQLNRENERRWHNPPNIEPQIGQGFEVRNNNGGNVQINPDGDTQPAHNVPMGLIREDWWIEYNEHEEAYISIRRMRENDNYLEINFFAVDNEGDEINLHGQMEDTGTWLDFPFLLSQWWNDKTHPDDLFPNPEV